MNTSSLKPGNGAPIRALTWPQNYPGAGPFGGPPRPNSSVPADVSAPLPRTALAPIQAVWQGEFPPGRCTPPDIFWPLLPTPGEQKNWPALSAIAFKLLAREQWRERRQAVPVPDCRPNLTMHDVVELGIAMLKTAGAREAAQFLAARDVPFAVIVRVLSEPERRRQSPRPA